MMLYSEDDRLLLNALADGELDAATVLALERRLEQEPALSTEYERICAVKAAMARLDRPQASEAFMARIAALTEAPASAGVPSKRKSWEPDWRLMAASLLLVSVLSSGLTYSIVSNGGGSLSVEDEIVSGHRRSLLASSAFDIASSDRHTVRPWLDAKLGVSPPTPDLAAKGFPLVGGRVDVIAGMPVPSLVYRRNGHTITVVAIPTRSGEDRTAPPAASSDAGYNIVRWASPGFSYWAVSDLDKAELDSFVEAMRTE
jgi:anti-sigma factor RsiW